MQVRPIDTRDVASAATLMERGFAPPPAITWAVFLNHLMTLQNHQLTGPIGYLLCKDGTDVGIILTLRSRRTRGDSPAADVVNLSSWYIDEPYRWYAPLMLKKVLRDKSAVFTDLSASEEVLKLLPALKFQPWTEGLLTTSLPQSLLSYRRDVSIVPFDKLDAGEISDGDITMLQDHARMGCISCVLKIDGAYHPLIFTVRRRRNIPHAYLIYAPDRQVVISALGNICAHLLKHAHFLVALDCNQDECVRLGSFRKTSWQKYFVGPAVTGGIDYAYSEFVYLGCT